MTNIDLKLTHHCSRPIKLLLATHQLNIVWVSNQQQHPTFSCRV